MRMKNFEGWIIVAGGGDGRAKRDELLGGRCDNWTGAEAGARDGRSGIKARTWAYQTKTRQGARARTMARGWRWQKIEARNRWRVKGRRWIWKEAIGERMGSESRRGWMEKDSAGWTGVDWELVALGRL